jgi:hypothetical protein
MASITLAEVEADVAALAIAAINANKPALIAAVNAGEAQIVTGLASLLKSIPVPAGIFGSVEKDIEGVFEGQLETYVQSLITKYGGEAVVDLVIALLGKA